MLRRLFKSRGVQLAIFIGSAALGAAGIFSGGWMLAKGDLSFTTGLISSVIPLVIGCIGLRKLSKAGRPSHRSV